jgi:transcriptional regulator with XRE-family HTH domain
MDIDAVCIRKLRRERGWSRKKLAEQAGISEWAVRDIERRLRLDPYISTVSAIAAALNVPIEELLKKASKEIVTDEAA